MLPQPSLSEYINGRYYQISIAFYYKFSLLCCFHIDPILLCRPFRYCERISWVIYPKSSLASGFPRKFLAKIKHSSGFHRKTEPRFSRVHVSFFFFFSGTSSNVTRSERKSLSSSYANFQSSTKFEQCFTFFVNISSWSIINSNKTVSEARTITLAKLRVSHRSNTMSSTFLWDSRESENIWNQRCDLWRISKCQTATFQSAHGYVRRRSVLCVCVRMAKVDDTTYYFNGQAIYISYVLVCTPTG